MDVLNGSHLEESAGAISTRLGAIYRRSRSMEVPRCGLLCIRHRVLMSRETMVSFNLTDQLNHLWSAHEWLFLRNFYQFSNPTMSFAYFETRRCTCCLMLGQICRVIAMSKRSNANIRMDQPHSRAICDEIGDRLRQILPPEAGPLPPRLQRLLDRLADDEVSPSIVPSLEDMGDELPAPRPVEAPVYLQN